MASLTMPRLFLVPIIVLAACASPRDGSPTVGLAHTDVAGAARLGADTVHEVAAAAGDGQATARLEATELALLRSPAWRRHFVDSLLAETEVEPRVTVVERVRMDEVVELIGADKIADAVAELEAWRGEGATALVDYMLGNVYARLDQVEQAQASYAAAVAKHPKFRRAWKNGGLLHFQRGDFAAAATELARVIELGGGDAVTFGFLGYAHLNLEAHVAAESAYRMATMLDPATIEWQMGLGRCMFKLQRYGDAVALFDTLIQKAPERADLWLLQANANLGLGQVLKAAECYEMVDRLGKSTADSLNRLGDIYANEEIYDLAVPAYTRALAMDPQASPDRPLRAARLMNARRANTATKELLANIDRLRGDKLDASAKKEMLHLRAKIADAEDATDEQVQVLEEIVRLDPLDGDALIKIGQHCGATGDIERAVFYFERAAGIEAFEADAKVCHAQLLVKQGKYAEALLLLRRAQSLRPRDNIQDYLERVERTAQARS